MSKVKEYQINYIKYAKAHNKLPEEMLKYDKARYPFYPMVEFILWVNKQKKERGEL